MTTIYEKSMYGWDSDEAKECRNVVQEMLACKEHWNGECYELQKVLMHSFSNLADLDKLRTWKMFAAACGCWGGQTNHTPPTAKDKIDFFGVAYSIFKESIESCVDK